MAADTLTPEQKLYVIERRAEFVSVARICAEWKVVWGKEATPPSPQSLAIYDATTQIGEAKLSPEHQAHFRRHREGFLEDRSRIGLSHANYRLQALQSLLDDPVFSMNPEMVQSIVEMAEKIEGGLYRQRASDGASAAEVTEYVRELMEEVKDVIRTHVRSPEEQDAVLAEIKKNRKLEGSGGAGG